MKLIRWQIFVYSFLLKAITFSSISQAAFLTAKENTWHMGAGWGGPGLIYQAFVSVQIGYQLNENFSADMSYMVGGHCNTANKPGRCTSGSFSTFSIYRFINFNNKKLMFGRFGLS